MYLRNIGKKILDLVYPPRCPFCEKIVEDISEICHSCKKELIYIKEPRCKKCSKQLDIEEAEYCYDCTMHKHSFEYGFAMWQCDNRFKKSIYRYKNSNQREYAKAYTKEIVNTYKAEIRRINPDCIIPIPLHKDKLRKRGFNQSEILAKNIGRELGIEVRNDLLIRTKKTLPQKQLNHKQRINNVKNAFIIRENDVRLNKVVLVDDIYTTGFTIDSAARTLIDNCSSVNNVNHINEKCKVYFITAGIGEGL